MTTGIIILCRMSSSRLPGKVLMEIEGIPILQHIYTRLQKIQPSENIVVATSDHKSDDPIAQHCKGHQMNYYRGDLNNVAKRFLGAALEFNFDYAIRINGDNLFIDLETLQAMTAINQTGEFDFVSNVKNRTFPFGMSIEIISTAFYQNLMEHLSNEDYQEHVTLYLYHNETYGKQFHFENENCPEAKGLKMAIDELKDYEQAKLIMKQLKNKNYEYNLEEIVKLVRVFQQ